MPNTQIPVEDLTGFWDNIEIEDYEKIHHIQVPESEANDPGIKLIINRRYLFRCRCFGAVRALEIAKEYLYRKLFYDEDLEYGEDPISLLSKVPINFSARCEDQGYGWLWGVSFDIISYAEAMNDPEFSGYFNFSAGAYSRESLTDIYAVPLLLQYRYPKDHPRRAGEIISANGTIQKDVALFTFNLVLIKEMIYPEAAAGFISYVNKLAWKGYPPRTVKITNISIRGRYTDPERDDSRKHYYTIIFEFQANDNGWDQVVAITDPETGEHPGDVRFDGTIQTGLTYPAGRNAHVLPSFDFHRIFPDDDDTTFQERSEIEFPIVT